MFVRRRARLRSRRYMESYSSNSSWVKKELKLKAEIMWPEKYLANKELNRIINDFKHIERKQEIVSSLELEND